jgi:hypothetical protein
VSKQEEFFGDVDRAVAEHRKMNIVPEVSETKGNVREHTEFLCALEELNMLPAEEIQRRWAKAQKQKNAKKLA